MTTADPAGGDTGRSPLASRFSASRFRAALRRRLGVDPRALAAFRAALGVVLLVDLALRARNLTAFYTDAGVLPRATLAETYPLAARLSLHALSGDPRAVALLFLVAAVAAAALAVGHRTRVATAVSLVLLASLQARNPFVLNAGDVLLVRLLGAGLLCPLGARWSLDAVRRGGGVAAAADRVASSTDRVASSTDRVAGSATALPLVLVVVVYVSNAVEKLRGTAWPAGEAVERVFRLTYLHGPLGGLVPEWSPLLTAATYGWLALLVASPLLIAAVGWLRAALAGTLLAAHLSMALGLQIGVFSAISAAALLPFFPPFVWDRVERAVAPAADRLRSAVGRRSVAATTAPATESEPLRAVRDRAAAAVPVLAAVLLVALVAWNGMALGLVETPDPVASVADPAEGGWDMFAPNPPSTDAFVLATATTADGDRIDALYGDPVARDRPPSDARAYPTARWRKLLALLADDPEPARVDPLLAHLCDRADAFAGDGRVASVSLSAVEVDVETGETRIETLGSRECRPE
ncbi:hypothetical protein [Halorubrum tebenquichense]|uniref:hypothetical protein n=1 Tax=Halorubrum tebenquichense TaxID=119434 RepID=UPI000677934F|nr:hypothetical protein [Halorubrum tebenquichense]